MSDYPQNKPVERLRALIADDSRIVRATLTKHLGELFDFTEAHDGEEAWETLLRNQDIALLLTDLTMPRLDGYGLLRRMRSSRAQRLRDMPVVVISGADEVEERRLVKEAGATDLITKGMATSALVSRLDLLAQLVIAQTEHEAMLDASGRPAQMMSPYAFQANAERRLGFAVRQQENFTVLSLALENPAGAAAERGALCQRIADMLGQTIRQSDAVARTGKADFTIATGNLEPAAVPVFADRLYRAAVQVLAPQPGAGAGAHVSCAYASLEDYRKAEQPPVLHQIWDAARRRAHAGLVSHRSGVIGPDEESGSHAH